MNALHVIPRYYPFVGGSELYFQEISKRLVRDGHRVTVYTTDARDLEHLWARNKGRIEERHLPTMAFGCTVFPFVIFLWAV
jgi:glycosyltransferase involved in cell wall biosynthesis